MKKLFLFALGIIVSISSLASSMIEGYWLVPDDDNEGKIQAAAIVYKKDDTHYCRMIVIYDEDNKNIIETMDKPKERAKGIKGNPYICGLDFIWDLKPQKDSPRYIGKVINPDDGNVYTCEVWFDKEKNSLVVRGEILIFGKNEYWLNAPLDLLPQQHRIDPKTITPKVPTN